MDKKCVHSRAYKKAYREALNAGKDEADLLRERGECLLSLRVKGGACCREQCTCEQDAAKIEAREAGREATKGM